MTVEQMGGVDSARARGRQLSRPHLAAAVHRILPVPRALPEKYAPPRRLGRGAQLWRAGPDRAGDAHGAVPAHRLADRDVGDAAVLARPAPRPARLEPRRLAGRLTTRTPDRPSARDRKRLHDREGRARGRIRRRRASSRQAQDEGLSQRPGFRFAGRCVREMPSIVGEKTRSL